MDAPDQQAALEAADEIDLHGVVQSMGGSTARGGPVAYDPLSRRYVEDAEYAEDVSYYLVDEIGDVRRERSTYYDDDHKVFDLTAPREQQDEQDQLSLRRRIDRRVRRANPLQRPETTSDGG